MSIALGRQAGTDDAPRSARAPCSSSSPNRPMILAPIDQLGWATACAGRRRRASARRGSVAERPAAGGQDRSCDVVRAIAGKALEDRIMLAIDRQQIVAPLPRGRVDHQRAGGDQRFLVGERDGAAPPRPRPSPAPARRSRRSPPSPSRRSPAAASIERLAPAAASAAAAGQRVARARPAGSRRRSPPAWRRSAGPRRPAPSTSRARRSARRPRTGRGLRSIRSSVERADRAGRAEDRDACAGVIASPASISRRGQRARPRTSPSSRSSTPPWPGSQVAAVLDPGAALQPAFEQVAGLRGAARTAPPSQQQDRRQARTATPTARRTAPALTMPPIRPPRSCWG